MFCGYCSTERQDIQNKREKTYLEEKVFFGFFKGGWWDSNFEDGILQRAVSEQSSWG